MLSGQAGVDKRFELRCGEASGYRHDAEGAAGVWGVADRGVRRLKTHSCITPWYQTGTAGSAGYSLLGYIVTGQVMLVDALPKHPQHSKPNNLMGYRHTTHPLKAA